MDTHELLIRLGIALGLGLLVGLQRERKGELLAGIRTFALITVLGTVLALVGGQLSGNTGGAWMVAGGAVALGAILAVGTINKARLEQKEIGLTTEIAALVMYGLGAYLATGDKTVALVLGGAVVLLLYWKNVLHGFVQRMGDADVAAMMTFVLIALVIWPVLPREKMGPYGFFNPFETWLVVVLVVGMSLGGYVLYKLVPPSAGALLGGAVGGLISSTAATVSYARRARSDPASTPLAAQAIMMANTMSLLRVMALLLLFLREQTLPLLGPLALMAVILLLLTAVTCWRGWHTHADLPVQENPTELKAALLFASLYTVVKLATAWGMATFGATALYIVAGVSGLTDVDAITLSMSQAVQTHGASMTQVASGATTPAAQIAGVEPGLAWRVILVAILSNLLFKGACVMVLGNARLKKWVTTLFGTALLAGVGIILLWPW